MIQKDRSQIYQSQYKTKGEYMSCCEKEKCCNKDMVAKEMAANLEDLRVSAVGFGLDNDWLTDQIKKYGQDILALLVEALRTGFTRDFVVEAFNKFGPIILTFLVELMNTKKMSLIGETVSGDAVVVGEERNILLFLIERFLPKIIEKYFPLLIDKYKDDIIRVLIDLVTNSFKNEQQF